MITVIIPTANRPAMLRTALQSVADQTAIDQVRRIVVSENGGTRASEAVCAEFPSLPIEYVHRVPMIPLLHGRTLLRECMQGDLMAVLHDDDWWIPTHLANALAALKARPEASMYCSGGYEVSSESSMLKTCFNVFPWVGSRFANFAPFWELSRLNVLIAELLGTMCHFSTMVIRPEAMKRAYYVYELDNTYDIDRMLIFALSIHGPVLYNPLPDTFIRMHPNQDCMTFNDDARIGHMCETTRWLVETSGKSWDAVANSFYQRIALCPCEAYSAVLKYALEPWVTPELARNSSIGLDRLKRREAVVLKAA